MAARAFSLQSEISLLWLNFKRLTSSTAWPVPRSETKLQALTVVHNYFIERPDGTTAAERFFETRPADLFEWLVERMPAPARPARRRTRPQKIGVLEAA